MYNQKLYYGKSNRVHFNKKITAKENRRNVIKILAQAAAFVGLSFASMYMFLYFILWADEISDKIVGLF